MTPNMRNENRKYNNFMLENLETLRESLFRTLKWPKTDRIGRTLEETNEHGKHCQRFFPIKALDLDNFIHVIKTSRSKKF